MLKLVLEYWSKGTFLLDRRYKLHDAATLFPEDRNGLRTGMWYVVIAVRVGRRI